MDCPSGKVVHTLKTATESAKRARIAALSAVSGMWGKRAAREDDLRQPPIEGDVMKKLRHYWGAYKLSRINNTRIGALREMLFKPF